MGRYIRIAVGAALLAAIAGCTTERNRDVAEAGVIGAAVGVGSTVITGGSVLEGAAIGGAAGAAVGILRDRDERVVYRDDDRRYKKKKRYRYYDDDDD